MLLHLEKAPAQAGQGKTTKEEDGPPPLKYRANWMLGEGRRVEDDYNFSFYNVNNYSYIFGNKKSRARLGGRIG